MLSRNLLIASAATATIVGATSAQALEIRGMSLSTGAQTAYGVGDTKHITGNTTYGGPNTTQVNASKAGTPNVFIGSYSQDGRGPMAGAGTAPVVAAGDDRGGAFGSSTNKKAGDPYLLAGQVDDTKLAAGVLSFAVLPEFGKFPNTDFNLNIRLLTFGPDGKFLGDNVGAVFAQDLSGGLPGAANTITQFSNCHATSIVSSGGGANKSQADIILSGASGCDEANKGSVNPLQFTIPFIINQNLADGATVQLEIYGTQTGNLIPLDKSFKDNVVRATVLKVGSQPQLKIWSDHSRFDPADGELPNTAANVHNKASGINTAIAAGGSTIPRYFTDFTTGSDNIIGTLEFIPQLAHQDLRYAVGTKFGLETSTGSVTMTGYDEGWQESGLMEPRLQFDAVTRGAKCTGSQNGVTMTQVGTNGVYTIGVNDGSKNQLALTGALPQLVAVCAYEDTFAPTADGDGSDGEIYSFTAAVNGVFGGFVAAARNMESVDRDSVAAFLVPWVASGTQASGSNAFSNNVIRVSNIGYTQASQSLHQGGTVATGATGQTPYGSNASQTNPLAFNAATPTTPAALNTAGFFPVDGGRVFARLLNSVGSSSSGAAPGGTGERFSARFNRSVASGVGTVGVDSIGQTVLLSDKVPAAGDVVFTSADIQAAFGGFNFVRGDLLIMVENSANEVHVDRRVTSGASAFWQPAVSCDLTGAGYAGFGATTINASLCNAVAGTQGATTIQTNTPSTDQDTVLPTPLPHVTDPANPNNTN